MKKSFDTVNQQVGRWNSYKKEIKDDAKKNLEIAKSQNKPVKYLLKK